MLKAFAPYLTSLHLPGDPEVRHRGIEVARDLIPSGPTNDRCRFALNQFEQIVRQIPEYPSIAAPPEAEAGIIAGAIRNMLQEVNLWDPDLPEVKVPIS
jgi:hypothetical protein